MQLNSITTVVRPRFHWEAIDLGLLMARRFAKPLYGTWFLITLPIFLLLELSMGSYHDLSLIIFWWLKPIWERPLLYILSHGLFGRIPNFKESLRSFPKLAANQWLKSLTWRRLSPTRSYDLPLIQLEGLRGKERSQRLNILHASRENAAFWWTTLCAHMEFFLSLGILALIYLFIPKEISVDWLKIMETPQPWIRLSRHFITYLSMSLIAPGYIAGGFALYLNRRTQLEAWDLQLAFQKIKNRILKNTIEAKKP